MNSSRWAGIDSAYVIATPERKDDALDNLAVANCYPEVIDAITDGDVSGLVSDDYEPNSIRRVYCQMSHVKALRAFLATDNETAVIFEDDLIFDSGVEGLTADFFREVAGKLDWNVMYLGYALEHFPKIEEVLSGVYRLFRPVCRHAYVVNRSGADEIIKTSFPMRNNGDEMMARLVETNLIYAYGPKKLLFNQNRERYGSTLGNTIYDTENNRPPQFREIGSSYHIIGDEYHNGTDDFNKDDEKAVEYWSKGADAGNHQCMKNLAWAYKHGVGCDVDKEKSNFYSRLTNEDTLPTT